MKQLFFKNSISSSYAANCIEMPNSSVESIFEIRWSKRNSDDLLNIEYEEESNLSDFLIGETDQSRIIKDNILYYITGFIVRKLLKIIDCSTCVDNFIEQSSEHNYSHKHVFSVLTDGKNGGGLLKSSKNVMKLFKYIGNSLIKLTNNFTSHISGLSAKIIISTKNYDYNFNILQNMTCSDHSFLENHRLDLVTLICKEYLKIRLHHVAKSKTSSIVSKRRQLTKLVLFSNM